MTRKVITWDEAVKTNQERNVVLFEEKKKAIAECTDKEQLDVMEAQVDAIILYSMKMKLQSLNHDAIELRARIRRRKAELTPPQQRGRHKKNCDGAVTISKPDSKRSEDLRNRKFAARWPNQAAFDQDVALMRAGDQEARKRLESLEIKPPDNTAYETTPVPQPGGFNIDAKATLEEVKRSGLAQKIAYQETASALSKASIKMKDLLVKCETLYESVNPSQLDELAAILTDLNNLYRKLENMRGAVKLKGVSNA